MKTESPAMDTESIRYFSVGIWKLMPKLSPSQQQAAVTAADEVLAMYPVGSNVTKEIPHFGSCTYAKCTAIVAVFVCSRSRTGSEDSAILAAARGGKMLCEDLSPSNA